ncbi:thioredoxin domain-containing protein [Paenibacillus sp. ACRRX]|nr:thioredoxin domain-containing protein [Paenibacillus sp. ACRRX]
MAKRDNKPVFLSIGYSYLLTHTNLSLMRCSRESLIPIACIRTKHE